MRIICIGLIQNELIHVIRNKTCIEQEEWLNSSIRNLMVVHILSDPFTRFVLQVSLGSLLYKKDLIKSSKASDVHITPRSIL